MPTRAKLPFLLAAAMMILAEAAQTQGGGVAIRIPKGGKGAGKAPAGSKALEKMARRTAELDRFDRMSPAQRQKALDRLPPERRQRIEQGLEQYRAMNPENRERLRNFEKMPEGQRDAVRQNFRRMQELSPGRRAMVRREMQQLRGMADADRDARLQSESFRRRFDGNEQGLIRDTVANLQPAQRE